MAKRYYLATAYEGGTNYGSASLLTSTRQEASEMAQRLADKTGHKVQLYRDTTKLKVYRPEQKQNPAARIGTKLTKVRIKVGKRTVNGMAKRVGGKVKVFVTPGVAKGLPKRYRKANPVTKFKAGDRVVDKDGFKGTVTKVTFHDKSHWYDVRFPGGYAVRYDSDLTKVATR